MKRIFARVLCLCSLTLFTSTLLLQQNATLVDATASEYAQALRGDFANVDDPNDPFSPLNPALFLPIVMELPR